MFDEDRLDERMFQKQTSLRKRFVLAYVRPALRLKRRFGQVLLVYPMLLLTLAVLHVLLPQANGVLATATIFAPYLFMAALSLMPLALRHGATVLRQALLMCAVMYGVCFTPAPPALSWPQGPAAMHVRAMTWNLLFSNRRLDEIRGALHATPATVVALQELSPDQADMIEKDQALAHRFQHRLLRPRANAAGMGLLSTYPILEHGALDIPAVLWSRLDLGRGRTLLVVNAHPTLVNPRWNGFESTNRDRGIAQVRLLIAPMLGRGEPLLLLGDFNVTVREPAYHDLARGLRDAYLSTGSGIGATWRPEQYKDLPFGVLRIDYVLTSPEIRPVDTRVDCAARGSDHCLLNTTFAIP